MNNIIRENDYMYIELFTVSRGVQYYQAVMKGLSLSKLGTDLDELEKSFTEYIIEKYGK